MDTYSVCLSHHNLLGTRQSLTTTLCEFKVHSWFVNKWIPSCALILMSKAYLPLPFNSLFSSGQNPSSRPPWLTPYVSRAGGSAVEACWSCHWAQVGSPSRIPPTRAPRGEEVLKPEGPLLGPPEHATICSPPPPSWPPLIPPNLS